jgi:hypothetical protein
MNEIDIGDYVHHNPSNEDWVVACVINDDLYWCGYPFGGSAKLSDCTLIEKSTQESKNKLIDKILNSNSSEGSYIRNYLQNMLERT